MSAIDRCQFPAGRSAVLAAPVGVIRGVVLASLM
jgi:hypothetical protein